MTIIMVMIMLMNVRCSESTVTSSVSGVFNNIRWTFCTGTCLCKASQVPEVLYTHGAAAHPLNGNFLISGRRILYTVAGVVSDRGPLYLHFDLLTAWDLSFLMSVMCVMVRLDGWPWNRGLKCPEIGIGNLKCQTHRIHGTYGSC